MNKMILTDTCFWYALFDKRDSKHFEALAIIDLIEQNTIVIPWPILYETINTRFTHNTPAVTRFEKFIKNPRTILISDADYREQCLEDVLTNFRKLSLVDRVIRSIISDEKYKFDYFLTYNIGDFIDVCNRRRIEIV